MEYPTIGSLKRLEHEYALKADLETAWAARPVALSRQNERMALLLEDPGGEPLDRLLGRPLEVSEFLRIAIPLAGALRQVHGRRLIHKDIKPANVLVDVVARRWPEVLSNALKPGWVPTKMGGPGAPDDLDAAHRTQVWLAVSNDTDARVSGSGVAR